MQNEIISKVKRQEKQHHSCNCWKRIGMILEMNKNEDKGIRLRKDKDKIAWEVNQSGWNENAKWKRLTIRRIRKNGE